MTEVEIRTCRPEELAAALSPIWHYFGRAANEDDAKQIGRVLPSERVHAAFDDGKIVAGAGAYLFETSVPAGGVPTGSVPTAGVMAVGVLPTHRRRGILSSLMRQQLDDVHERGEPLALLYATEGGIYRRYGYGPASISGDIALPRAHASLQGLPAAEGRARLVSREEALELFPAVYDRVRAETPGMLSRTRDWWEVRRLSQPPWVSGEQVRAVFEIDGRPEGYAVYRIEFEMQQLMSRSVVQVGEAIGATPAATREVWRFLLNLDWVETIRASFLPPDHPLFLLLVEPRRMSYRAAEALWVRLVDVGKALSARGYGGDGTVVLEVSDSFCSWNEGDWEVGPEGARRTAAKADLRLPVEALGSVYLGGFSFGQLLRAGRVEELRDGAAARADALFRSDRHPWCPEIF